MGHMDTVYRIAMAVVYFSQFLGLIYYNRRSGVDHVAYDGNEPKWILAARVPWMLALFAAIVAWIAHPPLLAFSAIPLNDAARIPGIVLGAAADIGLFWTMASLGHNISTTLSLGRKHELVTYGPYRYVRHPMYGLGIVLSAALSLVSANWLIGLLGISFQAFVMIARTPLEEKMLAGRFGFEYVNYCLKTGKYFPKPR